MSEDEATRFTTDEETDEVEAHHKNRLANEEAPTEGDDDVEAHAKGVRQTGKL